MRLPTLCLIVAALNGAASTQQQCSALVLPMQHLRLRVAVDGRVATIPVAVGQSVQAGDVLLTLDTPRQRSAIAVAEAELQQAEFAIEATKLDRAIAEQQHHIRERDLKIESERLAPCQERLKAAEMQLANRETLYQAGRVPLPDVQQARIECSRANEEWHTVGERVKSLQQEITISQLRLKRAELDATVAENRRRSKQAELAAAHQELAEASLRAPFAGTVARVPVAVGQLVDARRTEVLELVDVSRVRLRFQVAMPAARGLAIGQPCEVAVGASSVAAKIAVVDPLLDPTTATRGAEVVLDNAAGELLPGTTTAVTLPQR